MSNKDAVGILRGIKARVEDLEENVSTQTGIPNLLRLLTERTGTTDLVSRSTSAQPEATDVATSGDATHARENDAAAVDASSTSDSTSVATDDAGGWTWDDSHYDFDEWS